MNIDPDDEEITKIDGRTRAGKAARLQAREPVRKSSRGDVFIGHNGEQLTRTRVGGIDPFHIPDHIKPKGWDYQWNAVSIYNNSDVVRSQSNQMYMNGWRPVPAERHDGLYMPIGTKGQIVIDGQRLEERPKEMSDQARAEDGRLARQQMRDRDQSLMGGKANLRGAMQNTGFAMDDKRYRGTGGDLRLSIDPAIDVPAPSHKLAEPGE